MAQQASFPAAKPSGVWTFDPGEIEPRSRNGRRKPRVRADAPLPTGVYRRLDIPVLWGRCQVNGREHRRSLRTADPQEATRVNKSWVGEVRRINRRMARILRSLNLRNGGSICDQTRQLGHTPVSTIEIHLRYLT